MIQKILCSLLIASLPFAALAEHTHTPEKWDRDAHNHWQVCQCGEKMEVQPHQMEDDFCPLCQSQVWLYDDGMADVFNYDAEGDLIRSTGYDAQGQPTEDYQYLRTYEDEGRRLLEETLLNGTLVEAFEYTVNEQGERLPVKQTGHWEDGSRSINVYDAHGNLTTAHIYEADGTLSFEETTEYTYDDGGAVLGRVVNNRFSEGATSRTVYNQYDDMVESVHYAADGTVEMALRWVYEYSSQGVKLAEERYLNDRLSAQSTYNEEGLALQSIEYMEEGDYYLYEYDAQGNTLRHQYYDTQGQLVETVEYDFVNDEIG